MFEEDRRELLAAADELETLAARTTSGNWRVRGLLASRPEIVAERGDGGSEHVAEARANTAQWIVTVAPAVAGPIAAWLRAVADLPPIAREALAVARALTGPAGRR